MEEIKLNIDYYNNLIINNKKLYDEYATLKYENTTLLDTIIDYAVETTNFGGSKSLCESLLNAEDDEVIETVLYRSFEILKKSLSYFMDEKHLKHRLVKKFKERIGGNENV